jgi:serine/threonine-protein kinase 11
MAIAMSLSCPSRTRSFPAFSITGKAEISTTYGKQQHVKRINDYLLLGPIGEGSFSRVFVALHTPTGKHYAIKRIYLEKVVKSSAGVAGLQREVALMQHLSHPRIVNLHEVLYVRQTHAVYLVLDYANCGNLAGMIKRGAIFSGNAIRYVFKQITDGVAYLHCNRIVHQDLKPGNILLKNNGTVLISDFGTGHRFQSCARSFGTPAYQAPELINQSSPDEDVEPGKEDIWSLGITLYFLHFKRFPFPGENAFEIAKAVGQTELRPPEPCDPILWDLIVTMLQTDPRKRCGIHDILKHEYVVEAPPAVDMALLPIEIPVIDQKLPVKAIKATVITDGSLPELKDRPRIRYFQAPFPV